MTGSTDSPGGLQIVVEMLSEVDAVRGRRNAEGSWARGVIDAVLVGREGRVSEAGSSSGGWVLVRVLDGVLAMALAAWRAAA